MLWVKLSRMVGRLALQTLQTTLLATVSPNSAQCVELIRNGQNSVYTAGIGNFIL